VPLDAISGDGRLSAARRLRYLVVNAIANRSAYRDVDPQINIDDFRCDDAAGGVLEQPGTPSPSRALCDLYWQHLQWPALAERLGPLRMLDIGCGSGEYALRFARWSAGRIAQYVGVDIAAHPRWAEIERQHGFIRFRAEGAERIDEVIAPGTNLIVSQSALEHVADDRRIFEALHQYVERAGHPVLQLHAVPSAACLRTYLWHGYRQYTPRRLSAVTRAFADDATRRIVRLGGRACNRLHFVWITWPEMIRRAGDRRAARPDEYRAALASAIVSDMGAPQPSAAFLVLVIESAPRSDARHRKSTAAPQTA